MERHLRACPACGRQREADAALTPLLTAAAPGEAAAAARVTERWIAALTEPRPAPARPAARRRWLPASAAAMLAVGLCVFGAVTAPSRAIGAVSSAMAKAPRFHVRMEVPGVDLTYEAWGERGRGARVEERQAGALTQVVVDDGRRLRSYEPAARRVTEGQTRLKRIFRQTLGFSASRMLRRAAQGRLFEGEEWLGEARAREVAQVRRNGARMRRIQVDLRDGFFARMVIYADAKGDRLTQANLYLDRDTPDEEPSARVLFDYPDRLGPEVFTLQPPPGTEVRIEQGDPAFPAP